MASETTPYFSVDSPVFHVYWDCIVGDNIETEKLRHGNPGDRSLCEHCRKIREGELVDPKYERIT